MIDESAITQWRKQKPWDSIAQVEQACQLVKETLIDRLQ
jgi:hypothetical protein